MRKINILLLLLGILTSCQMKNSRQIEDSKNEVVFDSTYYILLNEAYLKKDTSLLKSFYDDWYKESSKLNFSNKDTISKIINDIFMEIYYPFDYREYGWDLWGPLHYRYAIIPCEIKYMVSDSINVSIYEMDTLKNFYPNPNLGKAKRLLDINPFKKSLELFLANESYDKVSFLGSSYFINTPISYNWKQYLTTPEVHGVVINKQLNQATAYLRLISTGISIELCYEDKKWVMKKVNELWIE